ncbi:MAG: nuclear transport factor 2 family protein [Myxococcales bacterium]|nr:nuclear transport factor 2 family protein [Myxococcales bacterium]
MRALVLSALVALGSLCACGSGEFSDADRETILNVLERQRLAWNKGDLDEFMRGYEDSEALVFASGGEFRRGYPEAERRYRARYGDDPSTMGTLEFEVVNVRPLGPDAAVVLGRWRLTDTPQAGEGVFSLVFLDSGDGWRIVHDHTSAK